MKYAVYSGYECELFEIGEIVSVHKTEKLAEKAAKNNSFVGIREVHNGAKRGEYLITM